MLKKVLANLGIILALVFITYEVLDWYNGYMNFVGNELSRKILAVFCIISIINGVLLQVHKK